MRDYKLTLNLIVNDTVQSKIFKQFDTGNEIELELYENERLQTDSKITLTNETVLAFFQLANNTVIQKNATIRNGNILITTTADVLSIEGLLLLECVIINGDKKTTTQTLQFTVLKSIDRNNAVEKLPTWDIVDALLDAGKSEQDRLKNETTRVSNESIRVSNESARVSNEENRKTSYTQIQSQWNDLSKAIKDSNVGQTVVTEVIAARTNKQAKTYNNLGERIDTIEEKVTSRDFTEKYSNGSSMPDISNIVGGKIILDEIQGNTLVNLLNKNMLATSFIKDTNLKLYGDFSLKYAPTNTGEWGGFDNLPLNPSHKYYLRGNVYISSYTSGEIVAIQIHDAGTWNNGVFAKPDRTLLNMWQMGSILVSGRGNTKVTFGSGGVGTNIANYDGIMVVDLTDAFGVGNEPTKQWCDSNIPYFEGMTSVNKIEALSQNENILNQDILFSALYNISPSSVEKTIRNNRPCIKIAKVNLFLNKEIFKNMFLNSQYVFEYSYEHITTTGYAGLVIQFKYSDGTTSYMSYTGINAVYKGSTVSEPNKQIVSISFTYGHDSATTYIYTDDLQLRKGTNPIPYVAHKQDKSEILTTLRKWDSINKEGLKTVNSAELVLNGSESLVYNPASTTNTLAFSITSVNDIKNGEFYVKSIISDKFISVTHSEFDNDAEGICVLTNSKHVAVRILKSKLIPYGYVEGNTTTYISAFKAFLNANNVTVVYQLATPTTEQLNKELLSISSYENGRLSINSNIPCNIKYIYPTNLSSAISSLRDYTDILETQITGLWKTVLSLADRELRMKSIALLTTETTTDLKNKINEILNVWR